MYLSKIITICVLCKIIDLDLVFSLPSFGTEHVHIKVHLAPKHSSTKDILKTKQPETHIIPEQHVNHKIIHHYHHNRSHLKKFPIQEAVPVLESVYLSELDRYHRPDNLHQHGQDPKFVEETFLIKTELNAPKPNGYDTNTFKMKQQLKHQNHPIETIRLIESNGNQHQDNTDHHIETVKFFGEKSLAQHQQEKQLEEVIKVIEAPKYITSVYDYGHVHQVKDVVNEEPSFHSSLSKSAKNQHYNIQYGYVAPEIQNSLNFQQVPHIYTQHTFPKSYKHIEELTNYEPFQGSFDYKQSSTVSHSPVIADDGQSSTVSHSPVIADEGQSYLTDYQKYLPSSENPQGFNEHHMNWLKQNSDNVNFDKVESDSHKEENQNPSETYMGYNSYCAGHVQGVDS